MPQGHTEVDWTTARIISTPNFVKGMYDAYNNIPFDWKHYNNLHPGSQMAYERGRQFTIAMNNNIPIDSTCRSIAATKLFNNRTIL